MICLAPLDRDFNHLKGPPLCYSISISRIALPCFTATIAKAFRIHMAHRTSL